jgi:ferrochelatase
MVFFEGNRLKKIGILLVNMGSPDAPDVTSVEKYLRQFLSDPHIVDLPPWFWKPVLRKFILPKRSPKSAGKYQQIWTSDGSPLTSTCKKLAARVEQILEKQICAVCMVRPAMRYGNPSIATQLQALIDAGAEKIGVLPLFPQSSYTTTASIIQEVNHFSSSIPITCLPEYFDHPAYKEAVLAHLAAYWNSHPRFAETIFSFHGIPQKLIRRGDTYEQQCCQTAEALAGALGLPAESWRIAFQSKFGPGQWTRPSTINTLKDLAGQGIESVQIFCPGFAADSLETIHEIAIELKEIYFKAGGKIFAYIPALNAGETHAQALAKILIDRLNML